MNKMKHTQPLRKSSSRKSLAPCAMVCAAVAMFLTPSGAFALITDFPSWEVASEFNDSSNPDAANPSGVWSYGLKPTLQGLFTLGTAQSLQSDITGWGNANAPEPSVRHNTRPVPTMTTVNPIVIPPHALILHPGANGEYAVLRFTAPYTGTYRLSGQFYALDDYGGTTTDVWILKNNNGASPLFSSTLDYFNGLKFTSFTSTNVKLKRGNTLDFEVGFGSNQTYYYDSTGLNAVIEKIK